MAGNEKVQPRLAPHFHVCLRVLVRKGYADDPGGVAGYLIKRGIDDLKRDKVITEKDIADEERKS